MSRRLPLACAAVALLVAPIIALAQVPPPDLAAADKLYDTQSYAGALAAYRSLLEKGQVPPARADEVRYRVCVALGRSNRWDSALAESIGFVRTHRGTVWEPRGLYWLGRLYIASPHQAQRIQGRIVRERDGGDPARDGEQGAAEAAPAENLSLYSQDIVNARDAFEAARVLYPRFRREHHTEADEVQLDFDLARVLKGYFLTNWQYARRWERPSSPTWQVDAQAAYSPDWPVAKKLQYLYDNAFALAGSDGHLAVLALLGKAVWLSDYHTTMAGIVRRSSPRRLVRVQYPYVTDYSEPYLRRILRDYPQDPLCGQATVGLAVLLERAGHIRDAERLLLSFVAGSADSPWVRQARYHVRQIHEPGLRIWLSDRDRQGSVQSVRAAVRNAGKIHLQAYRVPLQDVFEKLDRTKRSGSLYDLDKLLPGLPSRSRAYGQPVAEWDIATHDSGDYLERELRVPIPVRAPGAYLVEASVPGTRVAALVLVSDLVVVAKGHRGGVLYYAAHGRTGKPAAGVRIVAEHCQQRPGNGRTKLLYATTGADGLVDMPIDARGPGDAVQVFAVARLGDEYAAVSGPFVNVRSGEGASFAGSIWADRPVYRPGQVVHLRAVVVERDGARTRPSVGRKLLFAVRGPRGDCATLAAQTNAFGCASVDWTAASDAALGDYCVLLDAPGTDPDDGRIGQTYFSVEEYKKPEFAVTVTPNAGQVRIGETASVTVKARFFHGGAVAGARVTYRVYRRRTWERASFPEASDPLARAPYDYGGGWSGALVDQGEAKTDSGGAAAIRVRTAPDNSDGAPEDLRYTVEADVLDASRRTVSGSGGLIAVAHRFRLLARDRHGYVSLGSPSELQVATLDAEGRPVAGDGSVRIYRSPAGKPVGAALMSAKWSTGADGLATVRWTAPAAGRYRAVFTAPDLRGQGVSCPQDFLVYGPSMRIGETRRPELVLASAETAYDEGQTAQVLLTARRPDCHVLLTREDDESILEYRIVDLPDGATELSIPLSESDCPNVNLTATLVSDGMVVRASLSITVRHVSGLAVVGVRPDKLRYGPGDRARVRVEAHDTQGRPIRAEVSLSIWDASLEGIRKADALRICAALYGGERGLGGLPTDSAEERWPRGIIVGEQPAAEKQPAEWQEPPGMGRLRDWMATWQPLTSGYFDGDGIFVDFWAPDEADIRRGRRTGERYPHPDGGAYGGGFGGASGFGPGRADANRIGRINYDVDNTIIVIGPEDEIEDNRRAITLLDAAPRVRKVFADSAFWSPSVVTGADGSATVEFDWPENLTEWKATAVGVSEDGRVGEAEATAATSKDLLVRLQTPRFVVDRDEVVLSANVHNYLAAAARCRVGLALEGAASLASGESAAREVDVPAGGEARVDWKARVLQSGVVTARMSARSPGASDAMEMSFPAVVHGAERAVGAAGELHGDGQARATIELPKERGAGSAQVVVRLDPSLASVALGALPYLAGYPYDCLEQTVSRFVPAVVVAKALKDAGYDAEDAARRAQEARRPPPGAPAHPLLTPYAGPSASAGSPLTANPAYDSKRLALMVAEGLSRAKRWQNSDGSWGWWPGDAADARITTYVLYSLITAREAGCAVDAGMLWSGMEWLRKHVSDERDLDLLAYEARVLAMDGGSRELADSIAARLFEVRADLGDCARANLAIALHLAGEGVKATLVLRNLESTVRVERAAGTAWWGAADGYVSMWGGSRVGTAATILQAYVLIEPNAELAPMLARWLARSRLGATWSCTLDAAMVVNALVAYSKVTGEMAPDYTVTVSVGDTARREFTVNRGNALWFENTFVVPDDLLQTGAQELTVATRGTGTLYWSATTSYFSEEEPVPHASAGIQVTRRYYRLIPGTASLPKATPSFEERPNPFLAGKYDALDADAEVEQYVGQQDGALYERVAMKAGDSVASGDVIEVELELRASGETAYVLLEDIKPAGGEPVELRSGERGGLGLWSHMELRDQKLVFFIGNLPQGPRILSYRMRAVTPGSFHVMPAACSAMYSPEVRGMSDEMRLGVRGE